MKKIFLDFETRSRIDLKKSGAFKYASHESTEILCACWKIENGPSFSWSPFLIATDKITKLFDLLDTGEYEIEAHNAHFEWAMWNYCAVKKYKFPKMPFTSFMCTAARAAARSLPRDLETLARELGLPILKDMTGRRVMLKMCKPDRNGKWQESDADFDTLIKYCMTDVEVTEKVSQILPELTPEEKAIFQLDFRINRKGVLLDIPAIITAANFAEAYALDLNAELCNLTGGMVKTATQGMRMVEFLQLNGVDVDSVDKQSVLDALKEVEDPTVRRVLEIRQSLALSSVKKLYSMLAMGMRDSRARGTLLYAGANRTGRWSGKGIQIQNLPRGTLSREEVTEAFVLLKKGDYKVFKNRFPDVLGAISSCVRGFIVPAKGHRMFAGDFSAIEARVLFWLAGDTKGLGIYREGKDPYKSMAAYIFKVPYEQVTKGQRQLGKAVILGCVAKGTKIKTSNGIKNIEDVEKKDMVWDGTEWRTHRGVKPKGQKIVISGGGILSGLTPDHLVLSHQGWLPAGEIVSRGDISLLKSEIEMGTLKSCPKSLKTARRGVFVSAAYAEMKKKLGLINSGEASDYCAYIVGSLLSDRKEEENPCVELLLILNLERVGELVSQTASIDAKTLVRRTLRGMEAAALSSASKPAEIFWNTLLHSMGLIRQDSHWTELIMTGTTKKETLESYLSPKTTEIKETFDIEGVDVSSCYTLGSGLIVHNCGYGMGKDNFRTTVAKAPYFIDLTEKESKDAVDAYRNSHSAVKSFWYAMDDACKEAIKRPGKVIKVGHVSVSVRGEYLFIKLPSGRKLAYFKPQINLVEKDWGTVEQVSYMGVDQDTKKWGRISSYGGKWVENCTQAVARDLMACSMLQLDSNGYQATMLVHDEIVSESEGGSIEEYKELMERLPDWASGLPLAAEVEEMERYRK